MYMWSLVGAALAASLAQPPSPAARVLTLEEAVKLALVENLNLQSSVDIVQGAMIGENLAESRFNFKVTPTY